MIRKLVIATIAALCLAGCKSGVPGFEFHGAGLSVGFDPSVAGNGAKEIVRSGSDAVGITAPAAAPVAK